MPLSILSLILFTVFLSACAQLALKMGVSGAKMQAAFSGGLAEALAASMSSPLIWLGLGIYGLSVALWVWVLSRVDLSVAYPFVGVSFIVTMAFGAYLLDEQVGSMRIIGTLLIATGCVLVARSA